MLEPRLRDLLRTVRDRARAEGVNDEFFFHRERSSLIRLGNSAIALSTSEELTRFGVSVQEGRRTGSYAVTADLLSGAQLEEILNRARRNCAASPERSYQPIFGVVEENVDDSTGFDPALAALSPQEKADTCARVLGALKPRGHYGFSGSWTSGSTEAYVSSTANDHECYRRLTDSRLVLVLKEQERQWELSVEAGGRDVASVSADEILGRFEALLPLYEANAGYQTPLGRQRVLFGEQAVAELAQLALWGGFYGRSWIENRAFTSGKEFGAPLFSPQITLVDDPTDAHVFGMPFDVKGRRRRRFPLVEGGLFRGVVVDSDTAARYGRQPTGHDVGALDLALAPGDGPASLEAGLALAGDAIYIPHLHYVHMPDPSVGQFTGSSRFNALRVEGGAFTAPLLSTRLTDTIPNVLSHVVAVSSRPVMVNITATYGQRAPEAVSVPEYLLCDNVRVSDVADSF